jgi:hypothetical protein
MDDIKLIHDIKIKLVLKLFTSDLPLREEAQQQPL